MSLYQQNQWKEFRQNVIELDGNKCTACGRNGNEIILQVHHKEYIKGRKPWEYAPQDCKTLCKGCHAEEHNIIMPRIGWEYNGEEDLGDLVGTCEYCGSSLRYAFYIYHENWGYLTVGKQCCDNLTDTNIASNFMESQKRFEERKERFMDSPRWKMERGILTIKQSTFEVKIKEYQSAYYITIGSLESKTKYNSLYEAKSKVFDVIESGELIEYIKKKDKSRIGQRK